MFYIVLNMSGKTITVTADAAGVYDIRVITRDKAGNTDIKDFKVTAV